MAERLHMLESQVERLLVEVSKQGGWLAGSRGVVEEGTFEHDGLSRDAIRVAPPTGEEGTFENDGLTCPKVRGVLPEVAAVPSVAVDVGCATPLSTTHCAKPPAPRAFVGGLAEWKTQILEDEAEAKVEQLQVAALEADLERLRITRSSCEQNVVFLSEASLPDVGDQEAVCFNHRLAAQAQHDISVILELLGRADEPRPGIKFGPDRL
jgi:hypothetical protein